LDLLASDLGNKFINVVDNFSKNKIIVECDEMLIGDVFYNIMNNAVQALDKRGRLEIETRLTGNERVEISFIDDGKGISEDIKEYILLPNITDKPYGSGLGLAMSSLTVDQHHGALTYSSKYKRTVFTVSLPLQNHNSK
jgi:nitrogen-specific signal transduction histidine kinase